MKDWEKVGAQHARVKKNDMTNEKMNHCSFGGQKVADDICLRVSKTFHLIQHLQQFVWPQWNNWQNHLNLDANKADQNTEAGLPTHKWQLNTAKREIHFDWCCWEL